MSKERLEDIKKHEYYFTQGFTDLEKDFEWLIEQAERVQELEETVEDYKAVNKELHQRGRKVRKQNKRYREELDILGEVINSATNADKLNEEYERLKGLEGEE